MTGFGKSEIQLVDKKITISIKSLNSKNLDLNLRIPTRYREKEMILRSLLAKALLRGKVDFSMQVENVGAQVQAKINPAIVEKHIEVLSQLAPDTDRTTLLQMAIQFPDVLVTAVEELNKEEWLAIEKATDTAILDLKTFRKDEGEALEKDIKLRIENINSLLIQAEAIDADRITAVKSRLKKAIDELNVSVDENRFEQELIYYLEKLDITEEVVRLRNHLEYFTKETNGTTSNGKKLAFISQEIGREVNTMGSKANFAPLQKIVIQMKDELEKIKEQSLNIL
jgi:uncharacterized protein (TIGR00255 family)